jgi:hypothetical protein
MSRLRVSGIGLDRHVISTSIMRACGRAGSRARRNSTINGLSVAEAEGTAPRAASRPPRVLVVFAILASVSGPEVRVQCGTKVKPRANTISRALWGDVGNLDLGGREHHPEGMNELLVGYARVSTEQQDFTVQRHGLRALGVGDDRIYVDHGLTGTNRDRPGLRLALAACRAGDTLVVTKLDRLARS